MTEDNYREPTAEEIEESSVYEAGQHERDIQDVERERQSAYQLEADPIYFQWQAGESTEEIWKAKRAEIRERYPYPES